MKIYATPINGMENLENATPEFAALVDFYKAFNSQNMELMQNNWLQTEDASMSNPLGGVKRGWQEIQKVYEKIFYGNGKVYVEYYDFSIHQTENQFLAVGKERGTLTINNETISLAIRTTRVYQLHENRWQQLHHHGSMDDPVLLKQYQTLVKN